MTLSVCVLSLGTVMGLALAPQAKAQSVTIGVQGTLAPECTLSGLPSGTVSLGTLTTSGSSTITFTVDCNTTFAYTLTSANGALTYEAGQQTVMPGSQPFSTSIPYTVTTAFSTDAGSFGNTALPAQSLTVANKAICDSNPSSTSCIFAHSGTGAAATGRPASLTVTWSAPGGSPRLSGTYSDTLTLTVKART